ncbi:MAG: hypothetical protein H7A01_14220 [Hahellaceae bacterium]|nr:hypothetical protein [Hahellaceae bacterium]MCP5210212.1 hypothetical protein [Hahellaceae bacterium]
MAHKISRIFMAFTTAVLLGLSGIGHANTVQETPSALAMTGDALVARPALLVTTVAGAAVFIVSMPFSALGGNMAEAADVLVTGPAKATFVRCLGCTISGRKVSEVVEQ